jgi:hypothetical protein
MTERGGDKPTTVLQWAEGPGQNGVIEPPTAKKTEGWYEGTGSDDADLHPAEYENWLRREVGRRFVWLDETHAREFDDLYTAISAVSTPGRFYVHAPSAGLYDLGEPNWSLQGGAGAVSVSGMAVDGEWIFYQQGTTSVYKATPRDGSTDTGWPVSPSQGVGCLATDGGVVVSSPTSSAAYGVYTLERTDGSARATGGATNRKFQQVRANGYHAIGIQATGDLTNAWVYDDIQNATSITEQGAVAHGANINAVAMDYRYGYVGGVQGTSPVCDVRAFDLASRSQAWTLTLPYTSAPTVKALCADGEFVFISCTRGALDDGNFANLWAVPTGNPGLYRTESALTGPTPLWYADLTSGVDLTAISCDDYWLYVYDATGEKTLVLNKRTGTVVLEIADTKIFDADGVSIYGSDASDKIQRHWRGGPSREFMTVLASDQSRKPFHKLAVPLVHAP